MSSTMTGTRRLPGGEPRKASQRHSRRAAPLQVATRRALSPGDQVRWRERTGIFTRDLGDGEHAEIKDDLGQSLSRPARRGHVMSDTPQLVPAEV